MMRLARTGLRQPHFLSRRRSVFLIAVGAFLIAAFAILPAPKVTFRRSPPVNDRRPGDVRHVELATDTSGNVHALLEVWTDSDWDLEYWSSVQGLAPVAEIITNDLIEQSHVVLTLSGEWLIAAWLENLPGRSQCAVRSSWKKVHHHSWLPAVTILEGGCSDLRNLAVSPSHNDSVWLTFVRDARPTAFMISPSRRPSVTILPVPRRIDRLRRVLTTGCDELLLESSDTIWLYRHPALDEVAKSSSVQLIAVDKCPSTTFLWSDGKELRMQEGTTIIRTFSRPAVRDPIYVLKSGIIHVFGSTVDGRSFDFDGQSHALTGQACCLAAARSDNTTWVAWLQRVSGPQIYRIARYFKRTSGRVEDGTIEVAPLAG